jgi:hypothetical protein
VRGVLGAFQARHTGENFELGAVSHDRSLYSEVVMSRTRLLTLAATIAALVLAACSSPTAPSHARATGPAADGVTAGSGTH